MNNQNQTQNNQPTLIKNQWTIGMAANISFLVLLLLPFISVNGKTMHSNYRFFIWAAGMAALVLRIKKKDQLVKIASILSLAALVICYTLQWIGITKLADMFGAGLKIHMVTVLLLLASSVLMINPSLLIKKPE